MSYLFATAIIIGYLFVINKVRAGFLIQLLGVVGMLWMYYGVDGGVVLVNAVFLLVNLYGFMAWGTYKHDMGTHDYVFVKRVKEFGKFGIGRFKCRDCGIEILKMI